MRTVSAFHRFGPDPKAWGDADPSADPHASLSDPLHLPIAPAPARRTNVPLLASAVPVIGAIGLWLATGSLFALWFAALGPLIAGATVVDHRRTAHRDRRRHARDAVTAGDRIATEIERRHRIELDELRRAHPDAAGMLFGDAGVWRWVPGRGEVVVVGRGDRVSVVRVTGGADDDPAVIALRARATRLTDAPVTVPLSSGIAVVGPELLASAVLRALVVQLCLALPPGRLRVVAAEHAGLAWAQRLPHQRGAAGIVLALVTPGAGPPEGAVVFALVDEGAPPPPCCAAVLTLTGVDRGRLDFEGRTTDVRVEALGAAQASAIAAELVERALSATGSLPPAESVTLGSLLHRVNPGPPGALDAVIGVEGSAPAIVDLVADGPHAVVAGVTGSGKSELLTTWITALCATRSPSEVNFLLADFKGGTAFDALAILPHVTGVLTDLDGSGARRAIESLQAEIRWREETLARAGARDIHDDRVELPRLVIVVDEFAALVDTHPELQAVFTDVAARGRALGMHVVLGSQRATGVFRDSLLANCPLRISLRVADPADSRVVIGTDDSAHLPGGIAGRGLAFVRRAGDAAPRMLRVALTSPDDIAQAAGRQPAAAVRRPWLPELPVRIGLEEFAAGTADPEGALVLGLADEPANQRQIAAVLRPGDRGLLIVGAAGTGRSTAVATIAAQVPLGQQVRIGPDPESAWDAVAELGLRPPSPGSVVLIDDLDSLLVRYPLDYSQTLAERLEWMVRSAGDTGIRIVLSAQRLTGATARIAELLPLRAVLAMASRADFLSAGGDPAHYRRDAPPGRADFGGRFVQFAVSSAPAAPPPGATITPWSPTAPVTGLVTRSGRGVAQSWQFVIGAGATVVEVDEAGGVLEDVDRASTGPVVVIGDPEAWQRGWRTLMAIRSGHDLVIDTLCAADYRVLTGDRELPPYTRAGAHRGWILRSGAAPTRVTLPH